MKVTTATILPLLLLSWACSSDSDGEVAATSGSGLAGPEAASSGAGAGGPSGSGSGAGSSCDDGLQNGNETGIDCGGLCPPCSEPCTGPDCDKIKQAVSEAAFAEIFEMLSPAGECSSFCVEVGEAAGNCTMYRKAGAAAFYAAAKEFPDFLKSDDATANKLEVAALFSNVIQESGLQEWATPWQMGVWPPYELVANKITMTVPSEQLVFSTAPTANPRIAKGLCYSLENGAPLDSWLGRGPIQLTGESNYAQATFGMSMFNDLTCQAARAQMLQVQAPPKGIGHDVCQDKNKVSSDAVVAWRSALWFWTNMPMSPVSSWGHKIWSKQTCAQVMNDKPGDHTALAGTIQVINGGLECIKGQIQQDDGGTFGKTMRRINNYLFVLDKLGVKVDQAKVWSDTMTRCYQGDDYTP